MIHNKYCNLQIVKYKICSISKTYKYSYLYIRTYIDRLIRIYFYSFTVIIACSYEGAHESATGVVVVLGQTGVLHSFNHLFNDI